MQQRARPRRRVAPAEQDRPEQAFKAGAHQWRAVEMIGMRPAGDVPQRQAAIMLRGRDRHDADHRPVAARSEEHTSELPSLMRISYAVFCSTQNNTQLLTRTTKHKTAQ